MISCNLIIWEAETGGSPEFKAGVGCVQTLLRPCLGSGQIQDTKYQNIQGLGHAGQWGGDTTDIERDVVLKGNINTNRGHMVDWWESGEHVCSFMSSLLNTNTVTLTNPCLNADHPCGMLLW